MTELEEADIRHSLLRDILDLRGGDIKSLTKEDFQHIESTLEFIKNGKIPDSEKELLTEDCGCGPECGCKS